jgi:hypothetical protein
MMVLNLLDPAVNDRALMLGQGVFQQHTEKS